MIETDYLTLLNRFKHKKILLIGDFILDIYLKGSCNRIAPEASVPVVDLNEKEICLGGAANVAVNLAALGANVTFCTVVGNDMAFDEAKLLLAKHWIDTKFILADKNRTTITKTRVSTTSQTLVRFDEGTTMPLAAKTEALLIDELITNYSLADAVLIADYGKGVLTKGVIKALQTLRNLDDKFLAVDSKDLGNFACLKPDLVKPNFAEAYKLLALNNLQNINISTFAKPLAELTGAKHILVTQDSNAVVHLNEQNDVAHYPVPKIAQPNVSGAGDTFIAACTLAIVSKAKLNDAIKLAISAAAIAIQKPHTAFCTAKELALYFAGNGKVLTASSAIAEIVKHHKNGGKQIVFTNGCFDILHSGHVNYLKAAKAKGDILVVGLNNDESIKRLKGAQRPINALQDRIEVLAELSCIDYIIPFGKQGDDTPLKLIAKVKPHVFVKGGDYQYKYLPEEALLKSLNCEIVFIPLVANKSTSNVISKIQGNNKMQPIQLPN